jgi:hypothetical protein
MNQTYKLQILLPMRRISSMESKIEVISTVKIQLSPDLYKVVDVLNRTLKEKDLMFGLALDKEDQNKAVFSIYRT